MKKLKNLIAVMAMMSMAAVLTGCGDDDDDNDDGGDNNPNQPPAQVAPTSEAELTAPTRTYTVNVAGQTNQFTLTFPAAGQYQITENGTATEAGTISGATRTDNSWTLNVTPNAGQEGAQPGVLRLDFNTANQGTWTFTPTDGQAEVGQFTVTDTDPNPDPNPDPDPSPDTVVGKLLQITYPGGSGEKFQFPTETTVLYEETINGTYTWDATNRRINATLDNGDIFEITIPSGSTTATVVFRNPNINGGESETSTGEYTLVDDPNN